MQNCPVDAAAMAAMRSGQERDQWAGGGLQARALWSRQGQSGPGEACGWLDLLEQRMRGEGNDSKRRMRWDVRGGGEASESQAKASPHGLFWGFTGVRKALSSVSVPTLPTPLPVGFCSPPSLRAHLDFVCTSAREIHCLIF